LTSSLHHYSQIMILKMQIIESKFIFTLMLFGLCLSLKAQSANSIIGRWQNANDKYFQVEIFLAKDKCFYGKIISNTKTPSNIGKIILDKFIYNAGKKQFSGTMSPPNTDAKLSAEIIFVNADKLKLTVHKFFITKTINLIRI